MDQQVYKESFKIRASEVGSDGKMTLPSICGLLQEVAGNHAQQLNFDITDLFKQNLTWVLHRLHLKMYTFPNWRETITIETWPSAGDSLRAYRDFRIVNEAGEILGVSLTYWMMINLETRRPARMPQEVLDLGMKDLGHTLDIRSNRMKPGRNLNKLLDIVSRKSDLDMNHHINNVAYIEWICDSTEEFGHPDEIDIQFMMEAGSNEEIACLKDQDADQHLIILQKKDGNSALAIAELGIS